MAEPRRGRPRVYACTVCAADPGPCPNCAARRTQAQRAQRRQHYHEVTKQIPRCLEAHRRSCREAEARRRRARGCKPRSEEG